MKPLALLLLAATPALADPAITLTPAGALDWETTPEGVAFAALSGDRWTEAYFAMVKLPAGTTSPPHVKTFNMYGVMIEGEMTHTALGADAATTVGPGGYYEVPANMPHISACVSDSPCITMLYQDGAFDFLPVTQ
ncbi:cupin domain-containing protein [uncultured Tateyamaria sp.]|uniref:cupin domain-containing protein n=1 Tax=uncultured Tateyamaria sp. TaxID=455651 RepID=UPI002630B5DA|nr:cupin domain-containing protein [uncultured Tateyamaria sp.]